MTETPNRTVPGDLPPEAPIVYANAVDRAVGWAGTPVSWLAFLAMLISVFEVFARYGFNSPTEWVHETTTFLIAIIFLLGGPVALARNKHIRITVVYESVPRALRRVFDWFNALVALVFAAALTWAAGVMLQRSILPTGRWIFNGELWPIGDFQFERSGSAWNAPTPTLIKVFILIAAAVMLVQVLAHIVDLLRNRRPTEPQDGRP